MTILPSSTVTDDMVDRAWAAIVGADVAGQCFVASLTRGDLRTGLEAVSAAQAPMDNAAGIEWFECTFGVPLGDKPGAVDVERVRASVSPAHRGNAEE